MRSLVKIDLTKRVDNDKIIMSGLGAKNLKYKQRQLKYAAPGEYMISIISITSKKNLK